MRLSADDYSYSLKIKEQGYRNIYKSGLQYLHYYLNSGHWWIGPTIGQPKGDHYIKSDQVCPENLGTQDWEVFNANQQNWRFYTLSVSCIEKFIVDSEWSKWSTCNCDTDNPERTRYRQCFASFNGQSNEVDSKYCMDQFENTASLSDQIYYERKACICGENCPNKILVEGGSKQTRRTGLYLKQNLASDSVVTYYSEETQNYIYRTNENYWWIGDTKGEMSGGFVAQVSSNNDLQKKLEYQALPAYENNLANDSECPPSDLTLWRSYQNKKWRPLQDDGMFIKHIYDNNGGLQDLAGLAMDNSWSNWSDCSESCQTADNIPTRSRENQVTLERQYENCDNLPVCPTLVCCDKVKVETSDLAVRAKQSDRFGTYKIMSIQFNNKPVYVKTLPKIEAEDDLQARSIGGASNTISIAESSVYIYYMPSHKVWLSGEELGQKTGGLLGLPFSPASQHCPEETKTWWAYISSTWEYDESLTVTCDTQPEYSDWSDFSECDEAGNQSRSRICLYNCNRDDFEYETYETVKCQEEILEESLPAGEITYTGEWAQWSDWSTCSNTCGLGARKRVRQCATPGGDSAVELGSIMDIGSYFYDYNDDFDAMAKKQEYMSYDKIGSDFEPTDLICEGESEEIDSCKRKECPEWSSWTPWNECSETCGENGNQMRERECVPGGVVLAVRLTIFRNNFDQDDEEVCPGEKVEYKQCNRHKCPEWSEWSLWSPCSVTCGRTPGSKTRSRTCQQYDDSQALLSVGDESFINMIPCEGLPKEQMACLPTLSTCPTSSKCSDLKNRHQNINQCKSWVRRGLCNNEETKAFMHTNCKKTCCQSDHGELCADVQSRCKSYASYCSDPKHQRFMHEKCPITCGTCNTGSRSTIIKNSILLKGVSNLGLGGSSDDSGRIKPNHEVTSLDNLGGLGLLAGVPPPNFYLGRD